MELGAKELYLVEHLFHLLSIDLIPCANLGRQGVERCAVGQGLGKRREQVAGSLLGRLLGPLQMLLLWRLLGGLLLLLPLLLGCQLALALVRQRRWHLLLLALLQMLM